jgi:hypothetical protein
MSLHLFFLGVGAGGFDQRAEPDEVQLEKVRRRAPDQGCSSDRGCDGPSGRPQRRVSGGQDLRERLLAALAVVTSVCPRVAGALAVRPGRSLRARTGAEGRVRFSGHQLAARRLASPIVLPRRGAPSGRPSPSSAASRRVSDLSTTITNAWSPGRPGLWLAAFAWTRSSRHRPSISAATGPAPPSHSP